MSTLNTKVFLWHKIAGLTLFMLTSTLSLAEPIAMITDVQGQVLNSFAGKNESAALLSPLEPKSELTLKKGAKLVVTYFEKPFAYAVKGPAIVWIEPNGVVSQGGGKVQVIKLSAAKTNAAQRFSTLQRERLTQAAIMMKAPPKLSPIRLVSPVDTKVASQMPVLEWVSSLDNQQPLKLVIKDESGKVLQEATVSNGRWQVPQNATLIPGAYYRWSVTSQGDGEGQDTKEGAFTLASSDETKRLLREQPEPNAPFYARVMYAMQLETNGWKYEARETWKALAAEHPEDANLQKMAP